MFPTMLGLPVSDERGGAGVVVASLFVDASVCVLVVPPRQTFSENHHCQQRSLHSFSVSFASFISPKDDLCPTTQNFFCSVTRTSSYKENEIYLKQVSQKNDLVVRYTLCSYGL